VRLLGHRQTWSFFAGKFMTDGVWWFYLFWLPDYLKKAIRHGQAPDHAAHVHRLLASPSSAAFMAAVSL